MTEEDKLRLDYEQTHEYFRMLADIRFKLLAFVPTVTGLAVTLLAGSPSAPTTLAVGLLGLVVTLGIIVYELRNTQFYDATVHRAKWLEVSLGLPVLTKGRKAGGLFNERPARLVLWQWPQEGSEQIGDQAARSPIKVELWHDLGLALVYGAALGGWVYLIVDSLSTLLGDRSYAISMLSAAILASLFVWVFLRLGSQGKPQPTDEMRSLLKGQMTARKPSQAPNDRKDLGMSR